MRARAGAGPSGRGHDTERGNGSVPAPRLVHLGACPVCGDGEAAFAFGSIDLLHGVPGVFVYERCRSCGSFFQNPRAVDDDLGLCYPSDYFTHRQGGGERPAHATGGLQAAVRRMVLDVEGGDGHVGGRLLHAVGYVRRRARFGLPDEVRPPTTHDRCLELGPGTGDDMWRLAQLGWTVTGIDVDPDAAEAARARSGCPVVVGSILEHRANVPYGLIYGSHSIEHVPNIRETVLHLRSLLGPGGRLVLVVPNAGSVTARLRGPLSVVWDPPRHLSLPSTDALGALLRDAGFDDVGIRTSARRTGHYAAIARARRQGIAGGAAWDARVTRGDRLLQVASTLLVRLGADVGEEIVVSATTR